MKRGDKVRLSPRSPWRETMGDAIGTVMEASDCDMRGWVHFSGFGYAQG